MTGPVVEGGTAASPTGPTTLARVREVFSSPGFRRLFTTRLVSQFGDGVFQLAAVAVLLFESPGPNPALDLLAVVAVTLVPFSVLAPVAGVFIDRWDRRGILTWVPAVRALVALLVPVAALAGTRSIAFYAVILAVLSANRFFLATMSAVLPQLVPARDLLIANSVANAGAAIANVAGAALGSALAGAVGGQRTALGAAIAFAAAAVIARGVPVRRGHPVERAPLLGQLRTVYREMVEGARRVAASRRALRGLQAIAVTQFLVGGVTGVLVYYFIRILALPVQSATALLGILATGIGLGLALVSFAARRVRHDDLLPISFAIGAAGTAIAALALNKPGLLAGSAIIGVSYAFVKIPVDTIVQEEMRDAVRGRAFALYDMLFNGARVTGVAAVAIAYQAGAATRPIVAVIAALYALAALTLDRRGGGGPMFRRRKDRSIDPALAAGELVTVRAHAGHRADEEPRAIVSGGRDVPIDEIEWRAVVEEGGRRARVFVVRAAGRRVRLAHYEDTGWEIERVWDVPTTGAKEPRKG